MAREFPTGLFIPEAVWHGLKQVYSEPIRPTTKELVDEMLSIVKSPSDEADWPADPSMKKPTMSDLRAES